ncbi:MAG: SiaB family protein kinase, partial [Bacteroidales bacterium]|nr:SiaB family protein kinase [Bacteroidales bacterium]
MELARRLRKKLSDQRLMFAYRGEVTSDNSVLLLTLLEREMEFSEFGLLGRKRLFMFVLENLQNITRHGTSAGDEVMSLVAYTKTDDGYIVTTGNSISASDVPDLKRNLEKINHLEPDRIREAYRAMLQNSDMSSKGGAGLGLMEMARKTGNKLDYVFTPIDDDNSYFILSKTVDSGGMGVHKPENEPLFNGSKLLALEQTMKANNIYFIWSGPLTHEISKEVLSFNEIRMQEKDLGQNLQKRVFTSLIELLQNVAQHSPGISAEQEFGLPIAMIRNTKHSYIVTSGNLIRRSDVGHLKQKLAMINKRDEEGLRKLLHTALMGQDMTQI